jgi:hypothetical protein
MALWWAALKAAWKAECWAGRSAGDLVGRSAELLANPQVAKTVVGSAVQKAEVTAVLMVAQKVDWLAATTVGCLVGA